MTTLQARLRSQGEHEFTHDLDGYINSIGAQLYLDAADRIDADDKYIRELEDANTAELVSLREQVAALTLDAERYRFWRNRYPETFAPTDWTPEDVDRATDAAMTQKGTT